MYDATTQTLGVTGASNTDMGRRQHHIGMDRLPIVNRGREVEVFETGETYLTGDAANDPGMLIGMTEGLGVRSCLAVPLKVLGETRGVVVAVSSQPDQFHVEDVQFFETVARWIGMVAHHVEVMGSLQRDSMESARRAVSEELTGFLSTESRGTLTDVRRHVMSLQSRGSKSDETDDADDIQAALTGIDRLETSIRELVDASELERGVRALDLQRRNVGDLVHQVAEKFQTAPAPIHVRADNGVVTLLDPGHLGCAIEILMTNGVRRSPPTVPVIVNVQPEINKDGAWAKITVQDEGPTLVAESVAHMFFHFGGQFDEAPSGSSLYLARSTAEAHGGALTVEAVGSTGALFHLSIPIRTS
jgi:K+-sensing histidine kinase KdpD